MSYANCDVRIGLVLLATLAGACEERRASGIVTPTATAPSTYVLSGTVYAHASGVTAKTDALLEISNYGPSVPFWRTDAAGRYRVELEGWRGNVYRVEAHAAGYHQPCRTIVTLNDADNTQDIHLVSAAVLADGLPASFPIIAPSFTGRVFSRQNGDEAPVAGARVAAEFGVALNDMPNVYATTIADRSGRYLLCGMESATAISVSAAGFNGARVELDPRLSRTYDVELHAR